MATPSRAHLPWYEQGLLPFVMSQKTDFCSRTLAITVSEGCILSYSSHYSSVRKHKGSGFSKMHAVACLRSRNTIKLYQACGRRQALYRDNHLAQQHRGLLALVSQLLRLRREPEALLHSGWKLSVTAEGETKGDGRAGFSAGDSCVTQDLFFPTGFSQERLRLLLG